MNVKRVYIQNTYPYHIHIIFVSPRYPNSELMSSEVRLAKCGKVASFVLLNNPLNGFHLYYDSKINIFIYHRKCFEEYKLFQLLKHYKTVNMLNLHITLKRYSVLIKAEIIYKVSIAFYHQNLKIIHMSNN